MQASGSLQWPSFPYFLLTYICGRPAQVWIQTCISPSSRLTIPGTVIITPTANESLRRVCMRLRPDIVGGHALAQIELHPDREHPPPKEILSLFFHARYAPQLMPLAEHAGKFSEPDLLNWWRALCDWCAIDPSNVETGVQAFRSVSTCIVRLGCDKAITDSVRDSSWD